MNVYPDFSYIAKLLAEPTRAIILDCLMDAEALPASELAFKAKVSHPTISSHLSKLIEGKLIEVEQYGRHRYYRLANEEVAEVLEKIGTISPSVEVRSLRQSNQLKQVRLARTCYDHLAGNLGVRITDSLLDRGIIRLEIDEYVVTEKGNEWFLKFGVDITEANKKRRTFAKPCLDWSERHFHISGWLGCEIANQLFRKGWITKTGNNRSVVITESGVKGLEAEFNIVDGIFKK